MAEDDDAGAGTGIVAATANFKLSRAEVEFLLRLRHLRNQSSDGIIRVELNLSKARVEIADVRTIKREVFAF